MGFDWSKFFFSDLLFPSGDPSLVDGEFLDKFDIVVVSGASLKTKYALCSFSCLLMTTAGREASVLHFTL